MKIKLIYVTLLIGIACYSQSDVNSIIKEINNNLSTYSSDPKLKEVFLNRQSKILDIKGTQIPLEITNEIYKPESNPRNVNGNKIVGFVEFKCADLADKFNCITYENEKNISSQGFAFNSKKGAYLFIDLIYRLKKELSYE